MPRTEPVVRLVPCVASVCNSVVSRLWGKKAGRPMQALNIGWPIGAILGPLIAVPFVSEEPPADDTNSSLTTSSSVEQFHEYVWLHDADVQLVERDFIDDSSIEIAYLIAAALTLFVGCIHFGLYAYMKLCYQATKPSDKIPLSDGDAVGTCTETVSAEKELDVTKPNDEKDGDKTVEQNGGVSDNNNQSPQADDKTTWRDIFTPSKWAAGDGKFGVLIATLTVVFYTLLVFSAKGVGGYLVLYAVDSGLGFSNAEAARLQSSVMVFAIIGNTCAMLLAKYTTVGQMLMVQVHGQVIMGFLMLIFGTRSKLGLWLTSCVYTSVREPSFASGYTWSGLHIVLYAFILSMVSLALGVLNIPMNALQGWLYTNTVIESIFYTTIFWGVLNCLAVYVMLYVTRGRQPIQAILAKQRETVVSTDNPFGGLTPEEDRHFSASDNYSDLPDATKESSIAEIGITFTK